MQRVANDERTQVLCNVRVVEGFEERCLALRLDLFVGCEMLERDFFGDEPLPCALALNKDGTPK
jgi:hypothetical protein